MSWKIILGAIVLFTLVVLAAYWVGGYVANKAAVTQCTMDRQNDKDAYRVDQVEAVEKARTAQRDADAAALAETQRLLGLARAESVQAQKTASESKAHADTLSRELARLRNENPSVDAWNNTCLPGALLRSLHGAAVAPVGSACR